MVHPVVYKQFLKIKFETDKILVFPASVYPLKHMQYVKALRTEVTCAMRGDNHVRKGY